MNQTICYRIRDALTHPALGAALLLLACGPSKKMQTTLSQMESGTEQLRIENQKLRQRLEELQNNQSVIADRLETLKLAVERRPEVALASAPAKVAVRNHLVPKKSPHGSEESPALSFLGEGDTRLSSVKSTQFSNSDLDRLDRPDHKGEKERAPVETAETPVEQPEATRMYNEAFRLFSENHFNEAVLAFEKFMERFPDHSYADNARFWIAESYFRGKDFSTAALEFERVGRDFPNGNKVPEALLKAGTCYIDLARPKDAQRVLELLVNQYPKSISAGKARTLMASIPKPTQGRL